MSACIIDLRSIIGTCTKSFSLSLQMSPNIFHLLILMLLQSRNIFRNGSTQLKVSSPKWLIWFVYRWKINSKRLCKCWKCGKRKIVLSHHFVGSIDRNVLETIKSSHSNINVNSNMTQWKSTIFDQIKILILSHHVEVIMYEYAWKNTSNLIICGLNHFFGNSIQTKYASD